MGSHKRNKKSGRGMYLWPDSREYVGQWAHDAFEGKGIYTFPDGCSHNGTWYESQR